MQAPVGHAFPSYISSEFDTRAPISRETSNPLHPPLLMHRQVPGLSLFTSYFNSCFEAQVF
jgi:hypothetical protein